MGRHPKYWKDPLLVKPERWENTQDMHPYLFIPFQASPRLCLGQNMAMLEVKVMSVMLLKKFHLEAVKSHVVEPKITITLNTTNGVLVNVIKRL